MPTPPMPSSTVPPASAGLLRQLGAAVYDGLLIAAVLMVVTFAALRVIGFDPMVSKAGQWVLAGHRALLVLMLIAYFGHGWTRRGQTLGMKAWKIVIVTRSEQTVRWTTAIGRLAVAAPLWLTALGGLFYYMRSHDRTVLWALVPQAISLLLLLSPVACTLPDLLSGTRVVRERA